MPPAHMVGVFRLALQPRAADTCSVQSSCAGDLSLGCHLGFAPRTDFGGIELTVIRDSVCRRRQASCIRDHKDRAAPPLVGWDITSTDGAFRRCRSMKSPESPARLFDETARHDRRPAGCRAGDPAVRFRNRRIETFPRPPAARGLARTRDGAMVVVALGDGSLNVYRLSNGLLLASCRFWDDGTAIVLHDPTRREKTRNPKTGNARN